MPDHPTTTPAETGGPRLPAVETPGNDVNPICGCRLRSRCEGCGVCTSCDGCYCGEDDEHQGGLADYADYMSDQLERGAE